MGSMIIYTNMIAKILDQFTCNYQYTLHVNIYRHNNM